MEKNNDELSKMNLTRMNMVQLRAMAKSNNLRGYSRLRKNNLINMTLEGLKDNSPKDENKKLSKNKLKKISQKSSKLSKKSKNLRIDITNLKSQKMIWKKR